MVGGVNMLTAPIARREFKAKGYQQLCLEHVLNHERCALWLPMGTGKTSIVLTALDILHLAGDDKPTLVLAPLRVARSTWRNEAAKWNHLRHIEVVPIVGEAPHRREMLRRALDANNASVYTLNYENLPWLQGTLAGLEREWSFDKIVCDEITRLKGFRGSYRISKLGKEFYQGAGSVRGNALGPFAHSPAVKRLIELTGTPSPNGLQDLWAQAWYLDRGHRLGRTFEAFKSRWFQRSYDGYSIEPLPGAQEEIQDKLKDICMSINAADWFDIREPIVRNIYVDMPPKAKALYREMERKMFIEIEHLAQTHAIEAFNAASRTIKTLQLANGACYLTEACDTWAVTHDEKIDALKSVVEEASGAPLMVVYHFKSDLARLKKAFPHGLHIDKERDEEAFKTGKIAVAFVHSESIGHGVDGFQNVCNMIAFFGLWWSLEPHQQIIERIGPVRQLQAGLERPVFVYYIIARNTVDEDVLTRLRTKGTVQTILLEAARRRA